MKNNPVRGYQNLGRVAKQSIPEAQDKKVPANHWCWTK
jgi:hypothetical protein